jgi:tol-pal system protein YbgF
MANRSFAVRGRPLGRSAHPERAQRLIGAACLATALAGGCSGHIRLPDRVAETQAQVTDLQRRQEAMARELDELSAKLDRQEELMRQARADQNTRLADLQQGIEIIRNQIEQTGRQMTRLRSRPQNPPSVPVPAASDTTQTSGQGNPASPDTARTPGLDEEGLYHTASQNLQQGRYPLAISGFRQYLSQFSDGPLADEAQYGIGEAYYAQSDFTTAAIEFRALIDTYPQSDKLPAALLKTGLSYYESGKNDVGRAYLERVIQEHPHSEAARRAKERLRR